MRFKEFILNEQQAYLAIKVGTVLTAVQELVADMQNLGTRELVQFSGNVVNRIRRILHSNWSKEEKKFLLVVQKVGVAISKAIEDKDDLAGTLAAAASELEKLVADMGMPINQLASTEDTGKEEPKGVEKPVINTAAGKPPVEPQNMEQLPVSAPPTATGQDLAAAPLGGSAGPLGGF